MLDRAATAPNPTALRHLVTDEDVDHHRCVTCDEYDGCLDAALRHCWKSWTCGQCQRFRDARALRAPEHGDERAAHPSA